MFYLPDLELYENDILGLSNNRFYKMPALIHVARYIFTYEV